MIDPNDTLTTVKAQDFVSELAGATRQVELTNVTATSDTDKAQQALWTAIRTSTNATNFNLFKAYLDTVFCADKKPTTEPLKTLRNDLDNRAKYTFMGVDAYNFLKKATEADRKSVV